MEQGNKNSFEMTKNNPDDYWDIYPFIRELFRWLWLIILVTAVFGTIAYLRAKAQIIPDYTASFSAYIDYGIDEEEKTSISGDVLEYLKDKSSLYAEVLKSYRAYEEIKDDVSIGSYDAFSKSVNVSADSKTGIITVRVTTNDPQSSYETAEAIAKAGPNILKDVIADNSMIIINKAQIPAANASPNCSKDGLLGAVIGFVISVIIVILISVMDDRIKSAKELEKRFNLIVIGTIHNIDSVKKSRIYKDDSFYYWDNKHSGKREE